MTPYVYQMTTAQVDLMNAWAAPLWARVLDDLRHVMGPPEGWSE